MTEQDIIENLRLFEERFQDRGFTRVAFSYEIKSQGDHWIYGSWWDEHELTKSHGEFCENAFVAFSKLEVYIAKIPSKEDRERTEYLKRIANAIEYGKKIGIDEDFINPLELQMRKLSANIIEHKPAAADGENFYRRELDDDIPF